MLNQVKFSLILPVYNVEAYLSKCLHSVFDQTYLSYEVICINDGSTDLSSKILNDFLMRYPNMTIINQLNQGLGEARNAGMRAAKGEYIWFIDSDDWIEKDALASLSTEIASTSSDVILFNINTVRNSQNIICYNLDSFGDKDIDAELYIQKLLRGKARFFAWSKIFRREMLVNHFLFPKGWYEDVSLVKFYCLAKPKITILNKVLYNYNIRPGSIMRTFDKRILTLLEVYSDIEDFFKNDMSYKDDVLAFYFECYLSIIERANRIESNDKHSIINMMLSDVVFKRNFRRLIFNGSVSLKRKVKIILYQSRFLRENLMKYVA